MNAISELVMLMSMFGDTKPSRSGYSSIKEPNLSDADILKEYELIKQKQSCLSRSNREKIIYYVENVMNKKSVE